LFWLPFFIHLIVFFQLCAMWGRHYAPAFTPDDRLVAVYLGGFLIFCDLGYLIPYNRLVSLLLDEGVVETFQALFYLACSVLLIIAARWIQNRRTRATLVTLAILFFWYMMEEIHYGHTTGIEAVDAIPIGLVRGVLIQFKNNWTGSLPLVGWALKIVFMVLTLWLSGIMFFTLLSPSLSLSVYRRPWRKNFSLLNSYRGVAGVALLASHMLVPVYFVFGYKLVPSCPIFMHAEIGQAAFGLAALVYLAAIYLPRILADRRKSSDRPAKPRRFPLVPAIGIVWVCGYAASLAIPVLFGLNFEAAKQETSPAFCSRKITFDHLKFFKLGGRLIAEGNFRNPGPTDLQSVEFSLDYLDRDGVPIRTERFGTLLAIGTTPARATQFFRHKSAAAPAIHAARIRVLKCGDVQTGPPRAPSPLDYTGSNPQLIREVHSGDANP